ncbi:MAG: SAM-dependent methyltransferase [Tissierellia bacterium]|nr:SAM-dependent methyltransferase [Tissierellia bacterium]
MKNIYIIAGGPGDPDLLTLKGKKIIDQSDYIFMSERYLDRAMLKDIKGSCQILDSFSYSYDEKLALAKKAVAEGQRISFISMGDPSLYGMVGGLVDRFEKNGLDFEIVPGVSAAAASSAILKRGFTDLGVTNTSVYTSFTGGPEGREKLEKIARLDASVSIFMGTAHLAEIVDIFTSHRGPDTPIALIVKATWKDEEKILGNLSNIRAKLGQRDLKHGLILIGDFINRDYSYDLEREFARMKKKERRDQ